MKTEKKKTEIRFFNFVKNSSLEIDHFNIESECCLMLCCFQIPLLFIYKSLFQKGRW